jgi:hypothetical protein
LKNTSIAIREEAEKHENLYEYVEELRSFERILGAKLGEKISGYNFLPPPPLPPNTATQPEACCPMYYAVGCV